MKSIFYSFLIGLIIGGIACYFLLNKSKPVHATMTVTSSNPQAKITNEKLEVKTKQKIVEVRSSFNTDKKGKFTNKITINRRDLQYKNSIYLQTGYLISSQTPLLELGYSYNKFIFNTKLGYSFKLQEIDYGFSLGLKYGF